MAAKGAANKESAILDRTGRASGIGHSANGRRARGAVASLNFHRIRLRSTP
ncbi:hypothetical protein BRPE64_ACDS11710 [Caballeronia insecticola]|uniref:Uncharacterized protein n=1 Tax=Caballeronia insecticola TaxID=758793 RepID=R4WPW5_9BURK|nr:hypothetical protein BRPE64_ACDS11710 [Caballeronia insecticola]